ncbi:MAG TPA: hypothetical protein VEX68_26375 [Bryobacteraceae bacterium]|nr:hypothetical protein [Bryobacteraceae bacterium]
MGTSPGSTDGRPPILLDSGEVPIDQIQKFLGHLQLSTTQIYAETSVRALGENYTRAMGGTKP